MTMPSVAVCERCGIRDGERYPGLERDAEIILPTALGRARYPWASGACYACVLDGYRPVWGQLEGGVDEVFALLLRFLDLAPEEQAEITAALLAELGFVELPGEHRA